MIELTGIFLFEMLGQKGFGTKWIGWLKAMICKGSISIGINDEYSHFFEVGKGLRHGDPLPPLLFNLVAYVFTKMITKVAYVGQIKGLFPGFIPGGVISLQYANDTLLFLEKNMKIARNLKWLLTCFEHMSGMRINFHKCYLVPINVYSDDVNHFAQDFGCKIGVSPLKYLGVPLHYSNLRKEDTQSIMNKIVKRIASWRGRLLSYGGRLVSYSILFCKHSHLFALCC